MVEQVRPAQLDDWLRAHSAGGVLPLVLDVREAPELRAASVPPRGFELLHMPMQQVPARLAELDPQRPTACLCHHGARSQQVALFLQAQGGFARVVNLAGGIDAWSRERDPEVPRY